MRIRDATIADVPAILAIYNDVVTNTTAIYDQHPSTLKERQDWFETRSRSFPVLVGELDGAVVGFSTFGEWRSRWGYRFTVEHSVHVRADCRGKGFGRQLIEVLFPRAAAMHAPADTPPTESRPASMPRSADSPTVHRKAT